MKTYMITRGQFRVSPQKILGAGERILLEDDVAARFSDQLTLLPDSPATVPAVVAALAAPPAAVAQPEKAAK